MNELSEAKKALLSLFGVLLVATAIVFIQQGNVDFSTSDAAPSQGYSRLAVLTNRVLALSKEHNQGNERALEVLSAALAERKQVLKETLETNPREAGRVMIPDSVKKNIPSKVHNDLEKTVEVDGMYEFNVADDFNGKKTHTEHRLTTGDKSYRLFFDVTDKPNANSGSTAKVKGLAIDDYIYVGTPSNLQVTRSQVLGEVLGVATKRMAVIQISFRDAPHNYPMSMEDAARIVFDNQGSLSVNKYYNKASFGQWNMVGDVYRVYLDNYDSVNCNGMYTVWAQAARNKLASQGVNINSYNHVIHHPASVDCGFGGIANLPGPYTTIRGDHFGYPTVISHELGHNFGLWHANAWNCSSGPDHGTCVSEGYADPYDTMGHNPFSFYHFNNYSKSKHWLSTSNVQNVTSSGVYTLAPLEFSTTQVQQLKIPRDSTTSYYVEFRQPDEIDAFDPSSAPVNGLLIRIANTSNAIVSADFWPSQSDFTSLLNLGEGKALGVGNTFTSPSGKTVKLLSVSPTGAQVEVGMGGATCVRANPTLTINPTSQWGTAGQALSYQVSVRNNDNSNCGSSSFSLDTIMPAGLSKSSGPSSLNIGSGATANATIGITSSSSLAEGVYSFDVRATNSSSSSYSGVVSANYNVQPSTPPPNGPSANCTKAVSIVDATLGTWTIGSGKETLRNGIHMGGGLGSMYKYVNSSVYVLGEPASANTWYQWINNAWANIGAEPTCGTTPPPPPGPTPPPAPNPPPPPPSSDTTPPTISIQSPANGFRLPSKGNVDVRVNASDSSGISNIQIWVDGKLVKTCSAVISCIYKLNGSKMATGTHSITASAKDNANNVASASIQVVK